MTGKKKEKKKSHHFFQSQDLIVLQVPEATFVTNFKITMLSACICFPLIKIHLFLKPLLQLFAFFFPEARNWGCVLLCKALLTDLLTFLNASEDFKLLKMLLEKETLTIPLQWKELTKAELFLSTEI